MYLLMPVAMILMVSGMVAVGGFNASSMMMGVTMVMMTLGMMTGNRGGSSGTSRNQIAIDRHDYLAYLAALREQVNQTRDGQRLALRWRHPSPTSLWSFVGGRRMWERRPFDDDFLQVRIGTGTQRLARPLQPPQSEPVAEMDPICTVALTQFVRANSFVDDLPIAVRLTSFPVVEIGGRRAETLGLVRAMLTQACVFTGPDMLRVAVVLPPGRRDDWEWLKWLPHNHHPTETDALGGRRMFYSSLTELDKALADEFAERGRFTRGAPPAAERPHVLIVLDGGHVTLDDGPLVSGGLEGVTVLDLGRTLHHLVEAGGLQLRVKDGTIGTADGRLGGADDLSLPEAESLARQIAAFRLTETTRDESQPLGSATELVQMLGIGDAAALDPHEVWRPLIPRDLLRVPIGLGPSSETVEVDLKEAAQGGMGPHGLVVGATGSGKSELLRTLVVALAITHPPEQLNLVLIDFKGGATFAGLGRLPHTAATITNLEDDLALVDRMQDALSGEMNRRQEVLRDAGNFVSVREYERARAQGAPLKPLPSLLVICDEFSEMLVQKPDFAELFVAIGRLGRSLGIHLLLASQRLEEGRLRGLDSHLSYRIGLKTFSAAESRNVLGVPDAYELPPIPGSGYLKFDTTSMVRFKAAYVSGPYHPPTGEGVQTGTLPGHRRPVTFTSEEVELLDAEPVVEEAPSAPLTVSGELPGTEQQVVDVVISRLETYGKAAHEVWLPPLDTPEPLDALLPGLQVTPDRGLVAADWSGVGSLRVPVGLVDKPYEQRRDPLVLDLSAANGHTAIIGRPQTGKSMAVRTLLTSLALTHSPKEVQFFIVDLGGGSLASMRELPHVGGYAIRSRPDMVRRAIAEVDTIIADREIAFRELGTENMADYRVLLRNGDPRVAADPFGDVFLVIDGWGTFKETFEEIEMKITSLASRGLAFGVHLVVTANRWSEIRAATKDALGSRIELKLGDSLDSEVGRWINAAIPEGAPGRGVAPTQHHMMMALPRIDGERDPATVSAAYSELVRQVSGAWNGPAAPSVRMLPEMFTWADAGIQPDLAHGVPLAINEERLAPLYLDLEADPHFMYLADGESGKTGALRGILDALMAKCTSDDIRILLVDYRRTLLGHVPPEYLAGYAPSAVVLQQMIADLAALMESRLPGPDVTPEQLRSRSWWSGREIYVVIDDYDLVTTADNPMLPLAPLLAQAKDVGLHVILARRCAGMGRAQFEPLMARLRELATPGFVGTGPADEGYIIGNTKADPTAPPGRGVLVSRRHGVQRCQAAYYPVPGLEAEATGSHPTPA